MFEVQKKEKKDKKYLLISSPCSTTKAKICLTQGANIESFIVKNKQVITNLSPLSYKKVYASSVLFPFANRIKDGKYHFFGDNYTLDCNEIEANNALHGLIYNKRFTVLEKKMNFKYSLVSLCYEEKSPPTGFPFCYKINLQYKITIASLELEVKITNTGRQKFPFTLGWHPYFHTDNISKSLLRFQSEEKLESDHRNITTAIKALKTPNPLSLHALALDDAFVLNGNRVVFETPTYTAELISSANSNYLQLYTPHGIQAIAIEPMTGVSDSFNNKIGLKELNPRENYKIKWSLNILTNAKNELVFKK